MFETLVVYRLQQDSLSAIVQRIVYVEKCSKEAFDLLVVQAPKQRGTQYFEKPEFVRRKERFATSLQATHGAEILLTSYMKDGWKLVGSDRAGERLAS